MDIAHICYRYCAYLLWILCIFAKVQNSAGTVAQPNGHGSIPDREKKFVSSPKLCTAALGTIELHIQYVFWVLIGC